MQTLIITEKPSVAQAIAAVVGAITLKDGYLEGNGYVVGWCLGHLAQLVSAEAYDPRLSRWRVADLPILPQDWRYRVPQDKRKQFGILRGLMLRGDVAQVINACDAGREGELIFRNLYELTGCTKPTLRLWLNSMEEAEIRRALGDLRPGSDYDRLFAAARCRERADWLVGINATRLLSVTYHRTLNTGRVVSPTLAMLTQREADIASFVPEAFYTAELHLGDFSAESKRFEGRGEAESAVILASGKCVVTSISQKEKSEAAPALYDLTTLQRDANRVLGYTAQQTLDYAQSLYEKRLCTYPRTDSRFLTDGMADGVKPLVLCAAGICGLEPPFAIYAEQVCDSSKVTDHHALVPTMSAADCELEDLPAGECELLRLMAAQVLRAVSAPHRWLETSIELACGGFTYSVKGKTVLEPGRRAYDSTERRGTSLPDLHEGDELNVLSAEVKEGQTSPPAHFTEGSLLAAMENAGDTPDEAERKGLGTPATRAGIIGVVWLHRAKEGKEEHSPRTYADGRGAHGCAAGAARLSGTHVRVGAEAQPGRARRAFAGGVHGRHRGHGARAVRQLHAEAGHAAVSNKRRGNRQMPTMRLQCGQGQTRLVLREQRLPFCPLDRQQVSRRQAHPPEQVPGRPAPARRTDTHQRGLLRQARHLLPCRPHPQGRRREGDLLAGFWEGSLRFVHYMSLRTYVLTDSERPYRLNMVIAIKGGHRHETYNSPHSRLAPPRRLRREGGGGNADV